MPVSPDHVRIERLLDAPILTPATHPSIGENIQGPSLIRVPDWVPEALGRYYLYFADHKGRYIRLAYADDPLGPWTVHPLGSLQLEDSRFPVEPPDVPQAMIEWYEARVETTKMPPNSGFEELSTPHIASPDVHVNDKARMIIMYFHGLEGPGLQVSRVATSKDGLHFEAHPQILGRTYLRAFAHEGRTYAMAMPGQFYRSDDGLTDFVEGPLLFNPDMRHAALLKRGDRLYVFWTRVGHVPERILLSTLDLLPDWMDWSETDPVEVLRPVRDWEGADASLEPSIRSLVRGHVNQLRDPAIYLEDDGTYLLYAVAGESGIAIAEVSFDD